MNYKQAISLVVIFLGLVLVAESSWRIYRIDDIKDNVGEVISPFTDQKAQQNINTIIEKSYGYNNARVITTLSIGIGLIAVGSSLLYFFRKKSKR